MSEQVVVLGALLVLGLLLGSFLNVVIHRLPPGESLLRPGSSCPECGRGVRPRDNVPVLSWLLLRGRCRDCSAPIPWRYPAVEATTGLLFLLAGLRFGLTPYLATALVLLAAGVALFVIDLDHLRLPFAITGAAAALTLVTLTADAVAGGRAPLLTAAGATGAWLVVYGGIWLATAGRGMGLGDVALAPVLGLALGWLGWGPALVGLLAGFVVGAVVGVVLLISGRAERRSQVPHGPFLLAGAAVGLFVGQPVWGAYLGAVGIG